jgi:hypothetical protein
MLFQAATYIFALRVAVPPIPVIMPRDAPNCISIR